MSGNPTGNLSNVGLHPQSRADDVRHAFAATFNIPADSVRPDSSPENVDAWDSFGHMRLVTAIEADLGVRLSMEQILAIDSFAALCRTVEEARAGA